MLDYLAHIFTRIANNPRDNQPFKALFFFFFANTPRCTCKSVSTCSGSLNSLSLESPPRRNAGQRCEEETRGWRWSIYYMLSVTCYCLAPTDLSLCTCTNRKSCFYLQSDWRHPSPAHLCFINYHIFK